MSDSNCTPKTTFNKEKVDILLCEEDSAIRTICDEILSDYGFGHYEIVCDGEKAISAALTGDYGVLIFDPQMKSVDCYVMTKQLNAFYAMNNKKLFLVAHCSNLTKEEMQKCKDVGVEVFLSRPINLDSLNEFVEKIHSTEV
jgi:CheY-like chemotaxis protein